ncbi:MAG TPA: extracellular solute-binding protein [Candidatus Binatia bacterium]|jgi:iron(III) transport system substrate-binding protein
MAGLGHKHTMHKSKILAAALFLAVFCGGADFSPVQAQSAAPGNLIEAAKKDGAVVWYTTTSNEDNQAVVNGFNRKYPFVKVQILRTTGEKLRERILTEASAGQNFFDVAVMSGMELGLVKSRNLFQPYRSPEAAVYPSGAKDREGYFTGIYARNFVLAYNKNLTPDKAAPRDWPDLLKPEWKEKLGLEEEEFEWYGALIDYWGREKTVKFMKALAAQKPQLRRGHTLLAQLLAAGEFPVAIVFPQQIEQLKAKGARVEWVRSSDPIVTSINGIAVSAKARHPGAATLFVDFTLSADGQTAIRDRFRVPVRPGIPPAAPSLEQSNLKLHYVAGDMFQKISQYEREYREIFWGK